MKRITTLLGITVLSLWGTALEAQPMSDLRPQETVLLYATSNKGNTDPVQAKKVTFAKFTMAESNGITVPEEIQPNGNLANTSDLARFDLYFPKNPNGQMMIVCPGGGYRITSTYNEGLYVAHWMLQRGITVAVVKYRMPNLHYTVPLEDIQNTFRYCRAHAQGWGVSRIGVMGFSAGGHLAATVETMYVDAVTRPDFAVLIYPVITFDRNITHSGTRRNMIGDEEDIVRQGKSLQEYRTEQMTLKRLARKYSCDLNVTADTPPTYIALCTDDKTVNPENSIRMYRALIQNKVPVEMYIYPEGGHGWGFTSNEFRTDGKDRLDYCRGEFYTSLARFLESVK